MSYKPLPEVVCKNTSFFITKKGMINLTAFCDLVSSQRTLLYFTTIFSSGYSISGKSYHCLSFLGTLAFEFQ